MARVDLARRAEIGQERRARTRARISDAAERLLAERSPEALTVNAVVEAAGVAKGTFYYHFDSLEELFAAVGERLAETFDKMLEPARLGLRDPIARISFAFSQLLEKATADPILARLLVQSLQAPTEFARSIRANLKADLTEAKAQDQLAVQDVELAADIIIGVSLQVTCGTFQRRPPVDLPRQALDAVLRAIGAVRG